VVRTSLPKLSSKSIDAVLDRRSPPQNGGEGCVREEDCGEQVVFNTFCCLLISYV